ncbi:unnamed protein product [Mytilus coruscus]|uniref:CCHC-type domain-containing protein n=1 Tax=Mytilus coruscus TaxID=42192 RepID=A0A6J8AR97_MYTCO|nr:unnamed protein product [Mytilus coruscus]
MPTYGKLDSFDESEDWTQYVERMEHYFNANEIDEEDQKRDIFLSVLKDHRDSVPSEIIQRFKFNSRTRHSDESVRTFIAALRNLTEHCNYGDTSNAMLRDRFKDAKCHSCKKKGHIAKKCRNKSANGNLSENHREFKSCFKPRAHFMEQDESSESESENEVYSVFHFGNRSNEAYKVQINVNECEIAMEIDTGRQFFYHERGYLQGLQVEIQNRTDKC